MGWMVAGLLERLLSDEEELEVGEPEDLELSSASLLKRGLPLGESSFVSLDFLALRAGGGGGGGAGRDASVHCSSVIP